jgi:lipopolysaccharide export system permease protein
MLFHSSLRKELARSFGATLVVLFTIVLTMLLIRTLGLASRGSVNPEEVMLVLGYTVLGRMPTVLTLALFIAIVSTFSRLYKDSEMVIWLAAGRSLAGFLSPVFRFAWPILAVIVVMTLTVWPWANQQTDQLRSRFEQRGDLERVAPGQFQESSSGQRVFFIDKDTADGKEGKNIFISSKDANGQETITSARAGRLDNREDGQWLLLDKGQRIETEAGTGRLRVSQFDQYGTLINPKTSAGNERGGLKSTPTMTLLKEPTQEHQGELGWRIGMALTALNFVLVAVATTASNPRAGKGGNLAFTLFGFVFYYNLLNLGQSWVASGWIGLVPFLLALHGSVFVLALLWLAKRHHAFSVRSWLRQRWNPAAGAMA